LIKTGKGLIVFIKNPIQGKVKTRLAKDIGDKKALAAYKLLLQYTHDIVMKTDTAKYLYYSDFIEDEDEWSSRDFRKMVQYGDDLGKCMFNAIEFSLLENKHVVLIGSDCPTIKKKHIDTAFKQLKTRDVVLGPAEDGGYYLIAVKENSKALFHDIEWSTSQVLDVTLEKIKELGLSYCLIEQLEDVDTVNEWNAHKDELEARYGHLQGLNHSKNGKH